MCSRPFLCLFILRGNLNWSNAKVWELWVKLWIILKRHLSFLWEHVLNFSKNIHTCEILSKFLTFLLTDCQPNCSSPMESVVFATRKKASQNAHRNITLFKTPYTYTAPRFLHPLNQLQCASPKGKITAIWKFECLLYIIVARRAQWNLVSRVPLLEAPHWNIWVIFFFIHHDGLVVYLPFSMAIVNPSRNGERIKPTHS
jgi:hypothetical protein